jgi:PKHD-type hydroxylase
MFISVIENILAGEKLKQVQGMIRRASFVSGSISGGTEATKRNLELPPDEDAYVEALRIVEGAVRDHAEFTFTAFPRYLTRPIFSRYDPGMFYKDHVDFPIMGFYSPGGTAGHKTLAPYGANHVRSDLSMTLFLADPDTYDGGELSFPGVWEKLRFKLPAGSAVVYPTGAEHSVLPVTRGARLAAIFWVQSLFPNEAHRKTVHEAFVLSQMLEKAMPESPELKLAEQVFFNSFRMLASV